jgi:hypothetical protein
VLQSQRNTQQISKLFVKKIGRLNQAWSLRKFQKGVRLNLELVRVATTISCAPCRVLTALTLLGLTGFDMSSGGRACDPICSESLNGAKTELPTSNSLLPPDSQVVKRHRDQQWRTGPIHRSPATEAGDDS